MSFAEAAMGSAAKGSAPKRSNQELINEQIKKLIQAPDLAQVDRRNYCNCFVLSKKEVDAFFPESQACCYAAYKPEDVRYNICIASYRWLPLCDMMAVRPFPFQRRGTITLRLVRHIRRCIGSSIVYLRVPDEEDSRVLLDTIDVSRSRV